MEQKSPFKQATDLNAHISRMVASFDVDSMSAQEREVLQALKRQVVDVRLDMRDYGMAETAAEQMRLAQESLERLRQVEENIVKAGSLGLFGAADVAQLAAGVQQLMSDLQE